MNLNDFLQKGASQIEGLEESVSFTENQVKDENIKLDLILLRLESLREKTEFTRNSFSDIKTSLNQLRSDHAQAQRNQFESEKILAVADTSIQNFTRSLRQLEEESEIRKSQIEQLGVDSTTTEDLLGTRKTDLFQLEEHSERTREQILQTQQKLEDLRQELAEESRKYRCKEK